MKKTNNTTINTIGCNNIIDGAFVPESGQMNRAQGAQNALRQEAGAAPVISFGDLFDKGWKVSAKHFGIPANGEHEVVINCDPEPRKGKDGSYYVKFELYEEATGLIWTTAGINQSDLTNLFNTISAYNNGMLAGKSPVQSLNFLKKHSFKAWTVVTGPKKVATYFNEEKYDKRCYVIAQEASRKVDKKMEADLEANRENGEIPFDA